MAQLIARLLLLSLIAFCAAEPVRLSVSVSRTASGIPEVVQLQQKDREQACATGVYQKEYIRLGWNFLQLWTEETCSDHDQAFAAGYVEGVLSREAIWDQWENTKAALITSKELPAFLAENNKFVSEQVEAEHENSTEAAFWWQISLVLEQLKGLLAGYNAAAPANQQLKWDDLLRLNSDGDFHDLVPGLESRKKKADTAKGSLARKFGLLQQTVEEALGLSAGVKESDVDADNDDLTTDDLTVRGQDRCSALVKVLPDNAEIFISQASVAGMEEMLRIYKLYDFAYHTHNRSADIIPGRRSSFSSYPAHVISGDDFYLLSSGIAVVETTIGTFDDKLYVDVVKPTGSVFTWLRNMAANRLAKSGAEWTAVFSKYNSGTYNNQWLIVDYNLFAPGQPLKDGTLYILEQYPGIIATYDATEELRTTSYFASYNVPHNKTLFDYGGNAKMVAKYGDFYSIDKTPRALVFAREQAKVIDIDTFKHTMRFNDYKKDPLGQYPPGMCDYCIPTYNAEFGIASRGDLNPNDGIYPFKGVDLKNHANHDAKVTSGALFKTFSSIVVSGPTCDQQPPFDWSTSDLKFLPHQGHVTRFEFPWVRVDWEGLNGATLTVNSTGCSAYW